MIRFHVHNALLIVRGRSLKFAMVAFVALAALASPGWPQGSACDQHPSTEFVLQNRATMLWVAGSAPPMGDNTLGEFRIDAADRKVSMRFTASVDKPATSVWLYLSQVTVLPGTLFRVTLIPSDANGQPASSGGVSSTFTPLVGWQAVTFPNALSLTRCQVYHLVLEPETPSAINLSRYIKLITTVSRYPLEFQPEDPGTTASADSFFDLDLAFMVKDTSPFFIAQWKADHYQFNPIFAIQCNDGTRIGQPYDVHDEPHASGNRLQGQFFETGSLIEVDYVAAFVRGKENGDDKLEAVLYNASTLNIVFQTEIVRDRPGVFNRAHWFGGTLNTAQQLPAGEYYLMLHAIPSDGGRDLGYYPSMSRSTIPLGSVALDGTFGGSASYAVYSPNGGTSFFPHPGAPDMAFLLGKLADATPGSLAIYDEGGVYRIVSPPASEAALTASPGEVLTYGIQSRNIGPVAPSSDTRSSMIRREPV